MFKIINALGASLLISVSKAPLSRFISVLGPWGSSPVSMWQRGGKVLLVSGGDH